jgi:lysozyme
LMVDPRHDVWSTIRKEDRLSMILAWLTWVEGALGVKPIIYSRNNFLSELLGNSIRQLASYPLWISQFTGADRPTIPAAWDRWTFWQYTQEGKVDGVFGLVDKDRFNGSLDDLKTLCHGGISPFRPA